MNSRRRMRQKLSLISTVRSNSIWSHHKSPALGAAFKEIRRSKPSRDIRCSCFDFQRHTRRIGCLRHVGRFWKRV